MIQEPSTMQFGDAAVISPDGSNSIPAEWWSTLALLSLTDPGEAVRAREIARLEAALGVREFHRNFLAGGVAAVKRAIHDDRVARGLIIDEFSRIDPDLPFPGEGPAPSGHSLAPPADGRAYLRTVGIRPEDHRLAWFIVRAATNQEKRCEARLIEAGYAVYVPRAATWKRLSRTRTRVERSLFGGYFFVGLGAKQAIGDVVEVEGVHDVVRVDRVPRQVAFDPIAALVHQEVDGEFDRTRRDRRKDPPRGAPVQITAGMFSGWPAAFVERREDERIAVMLTMFGKATPYALDPEDVELPEAKEAAE